MSTYTFASDDQFAPRETCGQRSRDARLHAAQEPVQAELGLVLGIRCWLADKPVLRELYAVKEAINASIGSRSPPGTVIKP